MTATKQKAKKSFKIYTLFYTPFVMGGDVWQPRATMATPRDIFWAGGYRLGVFHNPHTGNYSVAELTSGAIVKTKKTKVAAIVSVRRDIASGDTRVMREQVEKALGQGVGAPLIEEQDFWSGFKQED